MIGHVISLLAQNPLVASCLTPIKTKARSLTWPYTICTPCFLSNLTSHYLTTCSFCSGHTSLLSIHSTHQPSHSQLRAFISGCPLNPNYSSLRRSPHALLPHFQGPVFKIIVPPFPALFYPERRLLRFFFQAFLWVPIQAPGEKPWRERVLPQFLPSLKGGVRGNTWPCSLMCFLISFTIRTGTMFFPAVYMPEGTLSSPVSYSVF